MRQFRVLVNGNEYRVAIEELEESGEPAGAGALATGPGRGGESVSPKRLAKPNRAETAERRRPAEARPSGGAGAPGNITAAMPGTILEVHVAAGDRVSRGQSLMVLEAMKMENDIMAPLDGVVEAVHVAKGSSVNSGDLLMVLS